MTAINVRPLAPPALVDMVNSCEDRCGLLNPAGPCQPSKTFETSLLVGKAGLSPQVVAMTKRVNGN